MVINGHRLLILARDRDTLEEHLQSLGADRVRRVSVGGTKAAQTLTFQRLARAVDGGVVVAPDELQLNELIRNLEDQLPWVQ